MAAVTLLGTATFTTASGSKAVTATPAAGDLILIVTGHTANTASIAPTDDQSGTYSQVAAATASSSTAGLQLWVRNSGIATAIPTIFTHAPGTTSGGGLAVLKVTGLRAYGLAAIRQFTTANNVASGIPTGALSAPANTGNPVVAALLNASNPAALTPPTGHTERVDVGYNTPATGLHVTSRDSGEVTANITWGSSSASQYGLIVAELDNEPVQALTVGEDVSANGSLRARYVDCNFVAGLAASLIGLAALYTTAVPRVGVTAPIFKPVYHQVEPPPNLLVNTLTITGAAAATSSPYDWPLPVGYRYYAQTDIPGAIFEPEAVVTDVIPGRAVDVPFGRPPIQAPQFSRRAAPPVGVIDPIPPLAVDLTDRYGYRPFRQPEYFRVEGGTPAPAAPPVGREGPYLLWDWPNPVRAVDVSAYTFDPPYNINQGEEEFTLAYADFGPSDPFRSVSQPDQIRNTLLIEGVPTALFEVRNVEWPNPGRRSFYEVNNYVNLVSRDQVITPPPPIRYTEWPHPLPARWTQHDTVPNILVRDLVATQLYELRNHDWPNPNQRLGRFRYFAQPDPHQNTVFYGIPGVPYLDIPLANLDWPIVYRREMDWDAHFISERARMVFAGPPPSTLNFSAASTNLSYGGSTTLSWTSTYLSSLVASGAWSGAKFLNGAEAVGPLYATATYHLTGVSLDQTHYKSVTITVEPETNLPSGSTEVRPAGRIVLQPKLAGDMDTVAFDFISALQKGDTIVSQSVACSVYAGTDPAASAMVIGTATVLGTRVSQVIFGGVAGVVYDLVCTVTTSSGNRLSLAAYLAVTANRSQTMSAGRRVWIPKKQAEIVNVPFDFVSDLQPTETISTAVVTAALYSGVDATPSNIIGGSPTIQGTKVYQKVQAGVTGCLYSLTCRVTTSAGQTLELPLYVAVQTTVP